MPIVFELPADIEKQLRQQYPQLDQDAKQAFAAEGYRTRKLSIGQVADILGTSIYEAEGFLKQRGIILELSEDEIREDLDSLRELCQP